MRHIGKTYRTVFVSALSFMIVFMPAISIGAGAPNAPQLENQRSVFICQAAVTHATRAVTLGKEGLVTLAEKETSKAVMFLEEAIELMPPPSHVHGRQAIEHLRSSKKHLEKALQHWEQGDLKQALDDAKLGRDYVEASILHAQCEDFLCR